MERKFKILTGVTLAIALSATGIIYSDGFFSKFFGDGSKNGSDFKSLLSNVPADTAYLIASKESIPKNIMEDHLQRIKDILAIINSPDSIEETTAEEAKKANAGKFFTALFEEYRSLLSSDEISETDLALKASSVIYGYEMMPVMRIGIANKDKMMAMIKRAEEKSLYKVELTKCGEYDCFESTHSAGKVTIIAVLLKGHLAISGFITDKKESLKKHLIGEAKPTPSYTEESWNAFLKENNYPGYGDGFINLKHAFNYIKPMILEGMQGRMDNKSVDGCVTLVEDHLEGISGIVIGTKHLAEKNIAYEVLFKTSNDVSTLLQTLANSRNISQRTDNAIFDFGVNIDLTNMSNALTQYSSFLSKSAEDNKCPVIQAAKVRKSMGGMALVMNMGLSQFNSLYASISDIQLDNQMQAEKIDAVISLGSNDPAGLIAMAGAMVPPIASLNIPIDGSTIKIPDDLVPVTGAKVPDFFLSRTENAINIFIGNDKPALIAHNNQTPEISFASMDIGAYIKTLTNIMDVLPATAEVPDMKVLTQIGEAGGKIHSTISADKRGLAITYRFQY